MKRLTLYQFCEIAECQEAMYYLDNSGMTEQAKKNWWNHRADYIYYKFLPPLRKYDGRRDQLFQEAKRRIKEAENEIQH